MNKISFFIFAFMFVATTQSFAAYQVCGEIVKEGNSIAMKHDGLESAIYSSNAQINAELNTLVGFRRVCVEASSSRANEDDIAVIRIVSRDE